MYHTIKEREEAHAQTMAKTNKKRKEYLALLSKIKRAAYYRNNYEHTKRKKESKEAHIKNSIKFLESCGYKVI